MKASKVFVIAEAGVNHNGSLRAAKRLIDAAAKCGVDAVKFQAFNPDEVVAKKAPKANYQKKNTDRNENQLEMIKKLELGEKAHKILLNYCRKKGVIFLSSAFDLKSIDLLKRLKVRIFKVPSGEITNLPYLRKIACLNKKIIMSTGMADLKEVKRALDVLISGGTKRENITILHCNTEYPTPYEDVNLKAMITLKKELKVNTGYSDHTLGIEIPIAAAALGASVIEKHFTLDKSMQGPDHKASLNPEELKEMTRAIRNIERALGNGIKRPSLSELKNIRIVRKSIVAAKDIKKGELLSNENIAAKRPATGISPMKWDEVINSIASRDFKADDPIVL